MLSGAGACLEPLRAWGTHAEYIRTMRVNESEQASSACVTPTHPRSSATAAPTLSHSLCNVKQGKYVYMEDLQGLESTQSSPPAAPPRTLQHIVSPLRVEVWEEYLSKHPDPTFAQYLLQGLSQGFRIGFQRTARCIRAKRNLRSTYDHPEVVDTYMAHEVDLKRVVRLPLAAADTLPHLQISPIGVIPKRKRPNKWRLIVDLSSPDGQSVNDGMDRAQCSIKYASIDDAVQLIRGLGEGPYWRSLISRMRIG